MLKKLYKAHLKRNLRLAVPISLANAGHIMVGLGDSIMVGHLGPAPLAAIALVNSIFTIILVLGIGISHGITPLISNAYGSKNYTYINNILNNGLLLTTLTGLIVVILAYCTSWLIPYFNQPSQVVDLAIPYLQILGLSLLPIMIFQSYEQFVNGLSHTKPIMYVTLTTNIINVVLNYIFIFGKLGLPSMGLTGAGIATCLARTGMAMAMGLYARKSQKTGKFTEKFHLKALDLNIQKKILNIGLPTGMQYFFEVGAFSVAAIMAGWIGTKEQAAHQIGITLAGTSYLLVTGFSMTATITVGRHLGKQNYRLLRVAAFSSILLAIGFMIFSGTVFISFNHFLTSLFTNDSEVLRIGANILIITALFQISDGIQSVSLGALRGIADVKIPSLIALICYWLISLPAGYILAFYTSTGIYGIWIGLLTGLTLVAITLLLRFHFKSKKMILNSIN